MGGRGPPTWALFTENVCENERVGFRRGGVRRARPLDPPMVYVMEFNGHKNRNNNLKNQSDG